MFLVLVHFERRSNFVHFVPCFHMRVFFLCFFSWHVFSRASRGLSLTVSFFFLRKCFMFSPVLVPQQFSVSWRFWFDQSCSFWDATCTGPMDRQERNHSAVRKVAENVLHEPWCLCYMLVYFYGWLVVLWLIDKAMVLCLRFLAPVIPLVQCVDGFSAFSDACLIVCLCVCVFRSCFWVAPHSTAAWGRQISLSYMAWYDGVGWVGCNNIHCIEHMCDATQLTWLGMLGWWEACTYSTC